MYSVVDAFEELISGKEQGGPAACRVRISRYRTKLENGIEYCHVEVTSGDGIQYGIEAFGEEALELRRKALASPAGYAAPFIEA